MPNNSDSSSFINDLERSAAYWAQSLGEKGFQQKDVIGLWMTVGLYSDLVHIYGLARAGFVPEVLNAKMTIAIVRDLLAKTGWKALIYDPSFEGAVMDFPLPSLPVPDLNSIPAPSSSLPPLPDVTPSDIALMFILPVPETHRWTKSQAQVQWPDLWHCYPDGQPLVVNNIGSLQMSAISYLSWSGHYIDADEFLAMVNDEGLNCLILYAPWFSKLLNIARSDPVVLAALKGMGQINYTGAALRCGPRSREFLLLWVMYATTETAGCLVSPLSVKGILPAMRVIEGVQCEFIPTRGLDQSYLDGDAEQRAQCGQLFDLFLPAEADNCPHPSRRNRPDGHITGDLFEEVEPGFYCFRGRNDDWIRTGKHLCFCDTKSIEDNVLTTCVDLVQNCVVVGHYRPAVVLFVEPIQPITNSEDDVVLKTITVGFRPKVQVTGDTGL
ncbi:hypothetical protein B0H10DRAFT_2163492 [Mycena sp. CBHHK59/15]|nr:hypothetical protein B0H10DRAFT_2163492 [Mycena sp. CBHHK59/15]